MIFDGMRVASMPEVNSSPAPQQPYPPEQNGPFYRETGERVIVSSYEAFRKAERVEIDGAHSN